MKNGDFYDLDQIKVIWQEVLSCVHKYFMLDGRSKRVHKFHFVFLNHLWYKDRLSFPIYLIYSLVNSLNAHRKKDSRHVLHEDLILLLKIIVERML